MRLQKNRVVALMLALLIALVSTNPTLAVCAVEKPVMNVIYHIRENGCETQLVESRGTYVYYERTEHGASAAQFAPGGKVSFYTDRGTDTIYGYSFYIDDNEMKAVVSKNTTQLSNLLFEKAQNHTPATATMRSSLFVDSDYQLSAIDGADQIVERRLRDEFGTPYHNRYLTSKYQSGVVATLYGSMSYVYSRNKLSLVRIGADLGLILVGLLIPAEIAAIIAFVDLVGGIYVALRDQEVAVYSTTTYYDQYAFVYDIMRFRAGKNQYGKVVIGEKNSYYEYGSVNKDYFFDDYDYILDRAIYNYLND